MTTKGSINWDYFSRKCEEYWFYVVMPSFHQIIAFIYAGMFLMGSIIWRSSELIKSDANTLLTFVFAAVLIILFIGVIMKVFFSRKIGMFHSLGALLLLTIPFVNQTGALRLYKLSWYFFLVAVAIRSIEIIFEIPDLLEMIIGKINLWIGSKKKKRKKK